MSSSPRTARAWLLAPLALVAALAVAVCVAWFVEQGQAADALDEAPGYAQSHGLKLALGARTFSGFPFRLRVEVATPRVSGAGGWAVSAPRLVAQAYVFAPRHWVAVAPEGIGFDRPTGGAVTARGQAVRTSVSRLGQRDWRLAVEALSPTFTPAPGARPFSLSGAGRVELEAKPTPDGRVAWLAQVDRGVALPESALWHAASGAPFDLVSTGRLGGGVLQVDRLEARAGPLELTGAGGALQAGADGRLEGALALRLHQAAKKPPATPGTPAAVAIARAQAAGEDASLNLVFQDGQARLGPFKLGPSPRVVP